MAKKATKTAEVVSIDVPKMKWRMRYKEYKELDEIFSAIDKVAA